MYSNTFRGRGFDIPEWPLFYAKSSALHVTANVVVVMLQTLLSLIKSKFVIVHLKLVMSQYK